MSDLETKKFIDYMLLVYPNTSLSDYLNSKKEELFNILDICDDSDISDSDKNTIMLQYKIFELERDLEEAKTINMRLEEKISLNERKLMSDYITLESMKNNMPIQFYIKDKEGKYIDINDRMLLRFGKKRAEMLGKTYDEAFLNDDKNLSEKIKKEDLSILEGHEKLISIPSKFILEENGEKKEKWIMVMKIPTYNDKGVNGIMGINIDITDQIELSNQLAEKNKHLIEVISQLKETESSLIKAKDLATEANKLRALFLSNMGHEIRTPMNGINGFVELCRMTLENIKSASKPEVNELILDMHNYLNTIELSSNRLLTIITDVLDKAEGDVSTLNLEKEMFDLNKAIDSIVSYIKLESSIKGIKFNLNSNLSECFYFYGDKNKILKILSNILDNAIKFTKEGQVDLDVSYDDKKGMVVFSVSDTGIGIKKEMQKDVFDPFTQINVGKINGFNGTGVGLAIAKNYVKRMGGDMWLESEEGKGTKFSFSLPLDKG